MELHLTLDEVKLLRTMIEHASEDKERLWDEHQHLSRIEFMNLGLSILNKVNGAAQGHEIITT